MSPKPIVLPLQTLEETLDEWLSTPEDDLPTVEEFMDAVEEIWGTRPDE